jgi:hypothetical protein
MAPMAGIAPGGPFSGHAAAQQKHRWRFGQKEKRFAFCGANIALK